MPYSIQTLDIFTDIPQHTVMCLCQDRSCIPQHSYVSLSRQELYFQRDMSWSSLYSMI